MFDLRTVNDVLVRATGRGDRAVMMAQDSASSWSPITSVDMYGRVRALADALRGWGLGKGDRVAILSENRWEWPVTRRHGGIVPLLARWSTATDQIAL